MAKWSAEPLPFKHLRTRYLKAKVGGAGSFGLCETLGSTVSHAAKPSSEAFGFGWMDLMGLGWIEVLIRLQKHRVGYTHCHSFSRSSFGFVLPARLPLELGRGVGGFFLIKIMNF